MHLDTAILAHGEVFKLLGSLFGALAAIVICIVNGVIAIPFGALTGWLTFRTRRKRVRIAVGAFAAISLFLGLWVAELVVIVNWINIQDQLPNHCCLNAPSAIDILEQGRPQWTPWTRSRRAGSHGMNAKRLIPSFARSKPVRGRQVMPLMHQKWELST